MPESNKFDKLSSFGVITAVAAGLYVSSRYSYLLFHSLIEIVTIAVAFTLFILTWNTRSYSTNNYLRLLGIGYAFIAFIDLLHTLAYKGMNVFPEYGANLPTQLWIAARYLQAGTLVAAPLFVARRADNRAVFGGYFAAISVLVAMVYSGNFPDCFIEGKGLTLFKISSEYAISALLIASLILLIRMRKHFTDKVFFLTAASIVCTILSELSFTAYASVYGFANMAGHFSKLAAFYLIYRAILVTGLKEPFDLIFRELKLAEEALQKSHDTLEETVKERTTELRASEEKYRALIECANDAVLIHEIREAGIPGPFIEVNDLACRQLGYTREEFAKLSPLELVDPRYRDDIPETMERLFKDGNAVFETAHMTKDGRSIPVEISTRAIEIGGTRLFFSLVRDISERKRAEQSLSEANELFGLFMRHSPIYVYIKEVTPTVSRVLQASENFHQMIGVPGQHMAGKTMEELFEPEFAAKMTADDWNVVSRGEVLKLDEELNGRSYTTIKFPIIQGNRSLLAGYTIDITERRKLEDQLRQAQKMEAIGTFAGGIAHDFNNMLSAIIGYGNIALMKMAKDDPQRVNIEHMLDAGERAAHLTKDLLLFSRKQISERKHVDMNNVIRKVEKFLKRVIGEDVDCSTVLRNEALTILGDAHQLEQVLMNLATNARDAMSSGGIFTITTERVRFNEEFISVHGYGKPDDYVLIAISDTGKGMDEATREHIFEPFFTTKDVDKGTGLGLAVVYGIIKEHEGFINVYSEPGRGTTFRIYLPLITAQVDEIQVAVEQRSVGGTETILLAEDDEAVRNMTRTVLENFGYSVIAAIDGQDAVIKYKENRDKVQLLLFDLVMPKKTGKEAYDEIKAVTPGVKALFTSGYAPDLVRQKLLIDEKLQVLNKPNTPTELLNKVRETLDR